MTERTVPILPSVELDTMVPFYEALGFRVTYRQARPNPYFAVNRGELDLHFSGIEGWDPAASTGSALVLVADSGALFDEFAAGLTALYGRLPIAGIPRITRPRRKQGTTGGFSIVDPAGNWLRVSSIGDTEDSPAAESPLGRVLLAAARQGDARGDDAAAIAQLENGLARHADASAEDRAAAQEYLDELRARIQS